MNRHKAYNLPDLLTILLDKSEFYANKCVDAGNNVIHAWLKNCHSKYVVKMPNIDPAQIVHMGHNRFLVPSESDSDRSYLVDMDVRHCSCPQGQFRGPCKHKLIVSVSQNIGSFDVIPTTSPEMRQVLMYLGTGRNMSVDWFLPLQAVRAVCADSVTGVGTAEDAVAGVGAVGGVALHGLGTSVNENSQEHNNNIVLEVDPAAVQTKLDDVLNQLRSKLEARICEDPTGYEKAVQAFQKSVQRLPSTSDSALQKCLHSFGKSVTQVGKM